eukprot:362723-Chlamydomonas_euryale.AAC.1
MQTPLPTLCLPHLSIKGKRRACKCACVFLCVKVGLEVSAIGKITATATVTEREDTIGKLRAI